MTDETASERLEAHYADLRNRLRKYRGGDCTYRALMDEAADAIEHLATKPLPPTDDVRAQGEPIYGPCSCDGFSFGHGRDCDRKIVGYTTLSAQSPLPAGRELNMPSRTWLRDRVKSAPDLEAEVPPLPIKGEGLRFPYQRTFDAIAAAICVEAGHIAISVERFEIAFNEWPGALTIPSLPEGMVRAPGQFLVDRIDELDWSGTFSDFVREWNGHVDPPLSRLRQALATAPTSALPPEDPKWNYLGSELDRDGGGNG